MKLKDILTSSFFLKSIFALSLFILIFISGVSYKHTVSITNSSDRMMHAYKMHSELDNLISKLKDAEIGQRGFIITEDSSFMEPYFGSRYEVQKSLYILKKIAEESPEQLRNIDTLNDIISLRFSLLKKTLKESKENPSDFENISLCLKNEKRVMDQIRDQISRMNQYETKVLKESQSKLKNQVSFTPLFTLLLLLFSLFVFIISFMKINEDLNFFKTSNKNLKLTNATMAQAETIGEFGTWVWDLDTNKMSFSDNHFKLIGMDQNESNANIETLLQFVHKKDRHIILKDTRRAVNKHEASDSFFRVIRADGALRYFQSTSKLIKDLDGKKTLIGIMRDVTESHKKNIDLKEKNKQLLESNKELSSFNYVASHDLQEPLRIIQTYISRINEKEQLSETGTQYFNRIQSLANRMQTLINDLLLFSRTNTVEKAYELTDFNIPLQNALDELAQIIEEKKAIIHYTDLPKLKVIPYQIQQLFANLIGNALKYSKEQRTPKIDISCENAEPQQYPILKKGGSSHYVKLTIRDNGMGFDQEFAEHIFVLFKRLHHKSEYPGTGIGLAICKKIVANHSGFIVASAQKDVGAQFDIFLPI